MPDDNPNLSVSPENPEAGSSDGTAGGTQTADADTFAAEREQYEARVRSFQSEADQAKARLAAMERELAEAKAPPVEREDGSVDLEAFAARLYSDFDRISTLKSTAASLRSEFDLADPSYFDPEYVKQFDNADALRAAVQADHNRVARLVDERAAAKEAALRSEMAEKYGIRIDSPAGGEGSTPAGEMSVVEFARLGYAEQTRLEQENPGITDRILRNAQST